MKNGKKKVLVVEDEIGVAKLQSRYLERAGFEVFLAGSSRDTFMLLERHQLDLILLDFNLPGDLDGLSLYAQMKRLGYRVPVILVTGFGNETVVIQAMRAGVRDFVAKSVEYLDYLPEAIHRVLNQVETERRLAESEARMASIINSAKDAIIVTQNDHQIMLFNAAAEKMFRIQADKVLGTSLHAFIPAEVLNAADSKFNDTAKIAVAGQDYGIRADKEKFPLVASVSRGEAAGRKFRTVIVRDMTEQKKLEEKFFVAQKMEAIGSLAGGMAHDFNNILTVIIGFSEMGMGRLAENDPTLVLLVEIRKAGERAAALTRQLLAFSRKQMIQPVVLDINHVVSDLKKMLSRIIGEDIALDVLLDKDLGAIKADAAQIEQILMNLVVNSRDAMPHGGKITISTRNESLSPSDARRTANALPPGDYAVLSVTDTGHGMDAATRARIFDPFFTTKEVGKGTGLGLATVYGIVKQNNGFIEVISEPGQGATFKVYLPCCGGHALAQASQPAAALPRGSETILLAEDEEIVRDTICLMLESVGYTVIAVHNGHDALAIGKKPDQPIDLLVTDVVMPAMSGRQLAAQLAELRPNLKVIYLSGYTEDSAIRHGVLEAGIPFLQKPFSPSALLRKVREVLDKPASH